MSEVVHYKGTATKVDLKGKTIWEFLEFFFKERGETLPDYCDDFLEHLRCEYGYEFYYREKTETLYKLDNYRQEGGDYTANAVRENNTIRYDLRYYNSGGFDEVLEDALDKMDK